MQIFVRDVEACIGRNEDGYVYGLRYHLIAEDDDGRRWQHDHAFDDEARAQRFRDKVLSETNALFELNFDHWDETYPAYGSKAYQQQDAGGYFRAEEKKADEGFAVGGPNDISWVC